MFNTTADGAESPQITCTADDVSCYRFRLEATGYRALGSGEPASVDRFNGERVHAVAGIGHPERFFATLKSLGADVIPHPRPDHAAVTAGDFEFGDDLPVVMTEKDAVKCLFGVDGRLWALSVDVVLEDDALVEILVGLVKREVSDS